MATKRQLVAPKGDKRFDRRNSKGRFNESDDVGSRFLPIRRRKAKLKTRAMGRQTNEPLT